MLVDSHCREAGIVAYADGRAIVMSNNISPLVCDICPGPNWRFESWGFGIDSASDTGVEDVIQRLPHKIVPILERPFDSLRAHKFIQSGVASWETSHKLVSGLWMRGWGDMTDRFPSTTNDLMA
jgi:hypothetical protein